MIRGILNSGAAAWAFESHAATLADAFWVDVGATPGDYNYLLGWESDQAPMGHSFVPFEAIKIAADKRAQAQAFKDKRVAIPETLLIDDESSLNRFLQSNHSKQWVLKFPTSCGAAGHKLLSTGDAIPSDWPKPFVVQEFIKLQEPEVYRLYCVARKLFGWNARRFPAGVKKSPWVAHARGARYVHLDEPPTEAKEVADAALQAVGLAESFGVVDLLHSERGWLALEVGTDGLFSHVDRDFENAKLADELDRRLAEAFWCDVITKPWGDGNWRRRLQKDGRSHSAV